MSGRQPIAEEIGDAAAAADAPALRLSAAIRPSCDGEIGARIRARWPAQWFCAIMTETPAWRHRCLSF